MSTNTQRGRHDRTELIAASGSESVVTRYVTGVFGLAHDGAMFFAEAFSESDMVKIIEKLGIAPKWVERYYDGAIHLPESYKTRDYFPQNIEPSRSRGNQH